MDGIGKCVSFVFVLCDEIISDVPRNKRVTAAFADCDWGDPPPPPPKTAVAVILESIN